MMHQSVNARLQHANLHVLRALRQVHHLKLQIMNDLIHSTSIGVFEKHNWIAFCIRHTSQRFIAVTCGVLLVHRCPHVKDVL